MMFFQSKSNVHLLKVIGGTQLQNWFPKSQEGSIVAEVAAGSGRFSHPPWVSWADKSGTGFCHHQKHKLIDIYIQLLLVGWLSNTLFEGSPPHTGQAGPAVVAPDAEGGCLVHWPGKGAEGKIWPALQAVLFWGWKGMYSDFRWSFTSRCCTS